MKEEDLGTVVGQCQVEEYKRLTCGVCKKHWVIPHDQKVKRDHWFCTWCGILQKMPLKLTDTES